jgi:hypothetical protein
MTKQELQDGAMLQYTGRPFDGYNEGQSEMTFLGYDSHGWTTIWVDYEGQTRMVSLSDIEIV